jgi:UDP-N-acetylmuramyl pentapeptide phosphotransferase/UDP-N-acetylglucosamine-1-phosphate transferase
VIDGYLLNYLLLALLVTYPLSRFATGRVVRFLRRRAVLDHPNDRSSHVQPTPRGGGIAVIAILVITWGHFGVLVPAVAPQLFTVLALAVALGAVSWLDDLRGLNPFLRLAIQAVAVVVGLWTMPGDPIFQGLLPTWAEQTILALCWLWFINLFNFMDGIDGIAGAETAAIGFGIALVAIIATLGPDLALYGVTLAAAALGFLRWNWQPAQIFLGDVGSVPIGFLIGWLLLTLAAEGAWIPALILPLYYLADATITLVKRLLRREKPWQAHRSHFYQRAAGAPGTHAPVVRRINATNFALVVLAALAAKYPEIAPVALLSAAGFVGFLLWTFIRRPIPVPGSARHPRQGDTSSDKE